MPFRFVHTADIHLDSPLRSLSLRNSDLAGLVGDATRQAMFAVLGYSRVLRTEDGPCHEYWRA